jgi:cytochrome c oxidase subunit 2
LGLSILPSAAAEILYTPLFCAKNLAQRFLPERPRDSDTRAGPGHFKTMMPVQLLIALLAAVPHLAYGQMQSALVPKGPNAEEIAELTWVIFVGGGIIFAVVMLLAAVALFGPPSMRAALGRRSVIIGGGIAFPVIVLTALLTYSFASGLGMLRTEDTPSARIQVVGELWWWRVRYLDERGGLLFETANEIHIPVGQPVELMLVSDNVIHSFWVPNLAGKIDMIPGHVNRLRLQADAPGLFRGQCAEYCGRQHAKMAFFVIAQTPDDYQAWLLENAASAREPDTPLLKSGKQLFLRHCFHCHTIRGTPANGSLGPDLTHVGSRHSIAAGEYPNTVGTFGGWIASSQYLKPGSLMPSFGFLSPEELRALAHYMESLQ